MTPRLRLVVAATLVVVAGALGGCSGTNAVDQENQSGAGFVAGDGGVQTPAPSARPTAPRLQGELLAGGRYDLADQRGKVVVVNVWGSWCAPCRAEAPGLVAMAKQWSAEGVTFVGVDTRDEPSSAKAFVKHYGITYPNIVDAPGQLLLQIPQLPPRSAPATLVIDRRGRIAALFSEAVLPKDLSPVLARVTAEKT